MKIFEKNEKCYKKLKFFLKIIKICKKIGLNLRHRHFVTGCTTGYTAFMKNGRGIIFTGGTT